MEIIKLNLIPSGVNPTCHAKQYDKGRTIRFELFNGLTPYTLQSGDTVTLNLRKPDNTIIEASVTATEGNKYVDLVTTEQMCAVAGYNLGTFKIVNGETDIGTLNFIMAVERDVLADGIASQSVIKDLDALVQEAVEADLGDDYYTKTEIDTALEDKADTDTTYTKTEVDDLLANKLYRVLDRVTSSDSWYFNIDNVPVGSVISYAVNGNSLPENTGDLFTFSGSTAYKCQIYYAMYSNKLYYRKRQNNVWSDWLEIPKNSEINDTITAKANEIYAACTKTNFNITDLLKTNGYFINSQYGTYIAASGYCYYTLKNCYAGTIIRVKPKMSHSNIGARFGGDDNYTLAKIEFAGGVNDWYEITVPYGAKQFDFTSLTTETPEIQILTTTEDIAKAISPDISNDPLAKINNPPTYISMFKKIVHIGDSLTRGQYDTTSPDTNGADLPTYSRPVFMERLCGNTNLNLGIGGVTAAQSYSYNWLDVAQSGDIFPYTDFTNNMGDCYIIALGTNDISQLGSFTGDVSTDIDTEDYNNNANTSVGSYAKIIQMILNLQPKTKIFVVTIPKTRNVNLPARSDANTKIKAIASLLDCYVIDLDTFAEQEVNGEFANVFKNGSHNNVLGYMLRARQYIAYIDWIIENNLTDFRNVQFIGTSYDYTTQ